MCHMCPSFESKAGDPRRYLKHWDRAFPLNKGHRFSIASGPYEETLMVAPGGKTAEARSLIGATTGSLPHDQQDDPSDQCQPSKYWRKWNSLVSFCSQMHRSHIEHFFLTGVVDALIGEGECAQNDQHNPNPTDRFHVYGSSSALSDRS